MAAGTRSMNLILRLRSERMASGPPSALLRALIVEDEAVVAEMLVNVLGHIGIPVVRSVTTKSEAMALLTGEQGVDIALVDINLDVAGGGIEVAQAAAARGLYVI